MQEQSSIGNVFSRIISVLFHPVFVPSMVYAFLLLFSPDFFFGTPPKEQTWHLVILAYTTITFPLLVVFLMWRLKFIDSMLMHDMKERYGPLIASMLFYFWTFWLFHKQFNSPLLLQALLLGVFLTTVCLFMATIFFKISLHSGAWGSVLMFAIICAFHHIQGAILFVVLAAIIAGLVGTTRLYLKEHIRSQVFSGYIVGALAQLLAYFICKIYI